MIKYFRQINKILTSKQKKGAIFIFFLILISMVLEVLTLNSLFVLLTYTTNSENLNDSEIITYFKNTGLNYDISLLIIYLFTFIFILKTFINIFISWQQNKFMFYTRAELSHVFFKGYLSLPSIFHLRSNTSDLINNITIEVEYFSHALKALIVIAMEIIILTGLSIFLLFINFKVTIISFTSLIFFSLIINFTNSKQILLMGKNRIILIQQRLKAIIEGLAGSKVFELTGSRENLVKDFSVHNNKIAKIGHRVNFRHDLPKPLFELFVLLIIGLIFIFNFQNYPNFTDGIPLLGVFAAAVYRLIPSFGKILSNIQSFQFNIQAAARLSKDIDKFNLENKSSLEKVSKLNFKQNINFKDVRFSYSDDLKVESNFVLKKVNLEIKKGSKIGIIGGSGSGKSTFLDLMMGLISPQNGTILIDDKKIKDVKSSWQKIIGCVPQNVFILDDTLKRNIAFGLPSELINDEKVNKAIELANLIEFKNTLNLGLETVLGDSGSRLSGGQRQRIGIARALYNDPSILIFDEATNALDIQTEKKIINEIFSAKEEKTIIFVSHNPENLVYCDTIYEVKERGIFKKN